MEKELKILLLEDNYSDAELLERTLTKADLKYALHRVASRDHFILELEGFDPDVIVSDHSLPSFDSLEALEIARRKYSDIPFILVSGSVSEEFAEHCMRAGVDDYILKDSLVRLPASIRNIFSKTVAKREKDIAISLHE